MADLPEPTPATVRPLHEMPEQQQRQIAELVAQPKPPPAHIDLGLARIPSRAWYEWHWQRGVDPNKKRSRLPDGLRDLVIRRDGLTCRICSEPVDEDDVHVDHIKPVAHGGTNNPANLQVTHSVCNLRKGAQYEEKVDR